MLKQLKRFGTTTFTVKQFRNGFTLPLPVALMWFAAIWPYNFKWLYSVLFSLLPCVIVLLGEFGAIVHFWPNVTVECNVGSTTITGLRFIFILLFVGFNVEKFIKMVNMFVNNVWISPYENKEAHEVSENGMLLSNCISGIMCSGVWIYLLMPAIDVKKRENTVFPFLVYFPFDMKSQVAYPIIYATCLITGMLTVSGVVSHDTLMNYMLLHTCTRLQLLCKKIERIGNKAKEQDEYDAEQNSGEITDIIQTHSKLISFINSMEELFNPQILMHFFGTSMLICILGIQILYDKMAFVDKTKIILYLITTLGQLFVNCYTGEKLMEDSFKVAHAVYNSNWPELSTTYRVSILMIMQRSQKPLHLTAGKFFDLSMMTFSSVLQSAFSYFALLKNLLERSMKT